MHTHSVYSDGTNTPGELLALAEKQNVSAVALCDHNTVSGLPDFLKAAEKTSVQAVCGAEFSASFKEKEVHILGLFIKQEHFAKIEEKMQDFVRRKEQSNKELIYSLCNAGYNLDYQKLKRASKSGQINRATIAAELTLLGYTKSIDNAFENLLLEKHGFYKPPKRFDAFEIIEFLSSLGIVTVLAHPLLNLSNQELLCFLPDAKKAGLVGLETLYPKFSDEQTAQLKSICHKFCLLQSGGSDYHGNNKEGICLGIGYDNLKVPYELLQKLESAK